MHGFRQFFETLWPEPLDGCISLWFSPSKRSIHLPRESLPEVTEARAAELQQGKLADQHVYFGMGLRRVGLPSFGRGSRGTWRDIVALPGWSLDIDFFNPVAHKAKNLPRTPGDAFLILQGGPEPTIVVNSGNGWHVHWLFERPLVFTDDGQRKNAKRLFEEFQAPFMARAEEQGWQLDPTAGIERVWRVPGFINHKNGTDVESLCFQPDERIPVPSLGAAPPKSESPTADRSAARFLIKKAMGALSDGNPNKKLIGLVLDGKSFAAAGERDHAMQRVCSTIAFLPPSKDVDADIIAEILRPSLSHWAAEPDASKTLDEEVAKAADKILRAQQDRDDKEAEQLKNVQGIEDAMVFGPADAKIKTADKLAFVTQHAVIQKKSTFYVWDFKDKKYAGPFTKDELPVVARDSWAGKAGFELFDVAANGQLKPKSLPKILDSYGTVAANVIGNMALANSYYDTRNKTFYEAIAPLRDLKPLRTPEIEEWLECLVGTENLDKVLDWIAALPQLDQQCCALYLDGASGAGKGMLANGLARLWHDGGPTPLENVLGDFNYEMFNCPLLFLDEGLPRKHKGGASAPIRRLVGSSRFMLNEKFVTPRVVAGSIRLLIAANNSNVLMFGNEEMSIDDLEAVIGRFLHLRARPEAAEWLEEHNTGTNGTRLTSKWVEGDLLARHCLWLRENRTIKPGKRFLVEGEKADEIHRKFVMQGTTSNMVFEWLTRFASDPLKLYQAYNRGRPLARVGNGQLLINTQGVIDQWNLYISEQYQQPTTRFVGRSLQQLAEGQVRLGPRGDRVRFHEIKTDFLLAWAKENQVGNEDQMLENIQTEKEFGDEADAN